MTYTEFIIGVENNIAKANCNHLIIGGLSNEEIRIRAKI